MELLEKVAYLKGMLSGMELDAEKKETKLITAMLDVIDDLAASVTDLEEETNEICELIDVLDEDLGNVEEAVFDDEDEDDDDYEDEMYEVTCPSCGETLCVDEEMLDEGEMACPACGEALEFDLDIGECTCGCDCEDDHCDCKD
ncbi:MAG: hypothetical protein RR977_01195 [Oscillospiraceae bacterium]